MYNVYDLFANRHVVLELQQFDVPPATILQSNGYVIFTNQLVHYDLVSSPALLFIANHDIVTFIKSTSKTRPCIWVGTT